MTDQLPAAEPPAAPQRAAAVAALICVAGVALLVVVVLVSHPIALAAALAGIGVAVTAAVRTVVHAGAHRFRWAVAAAVGLAAAAGSIGWIGVEQPLAIVGIVVLGLAGGATAIYAQRGYVRFHAAPPVTGPRRRLQHHRAVLFLNPKSGDGKVEEFDLVAEAQRRDIETVVLGPDDDLTALAEQAVAEGAQVLGMAGGDGSQAEVAAVASAHDLPFVCIPAGTKNHFALDLNLDRNDPRRALDAFVDGVERRVDYGLVNGRLFVNNVALGVYPHVVQDPAYREGRLKAAASVIPELIDPDTPALDLRFCSPTGEAYQTAQVLLVSNNPYRSSMGVDGAGRRVALDSGELGVVVVAVDAPAELATAVRRMVLGIPLEDIAGCDQWTATELIVESGEEPVLVGIDGEAQELAAPLEMRIVPGGLRVVVPVGTPEVPVETDKLLAPKTLVSLAEIAGGAAPDDAESTGEASEAG